MEGVVGGGVGTGLGSGLGSAPSSVLGTGVGSGEGSTVGSVVGGSWTAGGDVVTALAATLAESGSLSEAAAVARESEK